jgi:hypothetical protein
LHAHLPHLGDLPGHFVDSLRADADAVVAAQGLAAEFKQNSPVFRFQDFFHKPF